MIASLLGGMRKRLLFRSPGECSQTLRRLQGALVDEGMLRSCSPAR